MVHLLRILKLKLRHKKISWRSNFGENVNLFSPIEIGAHCLINNSTIKSHVSVFKNSVINYSTINDFCRISNGASITKSELGSYSYVSEGCRIANATIGKFCSIGPGVIIAGGKHPVHFLSTSPAFYSMAKQNGTTFSDKNYFEESMPTAIGNDVWIGANVYISDGIEIGNGAVIGAGAVVTKNVSPYSVIGGVPAKEIKKRFSDEKINAIEKIKWWEWDTEKLSRNIKLFQKSDFHLDEIK